MPPVWVPENLPGDFRKLWPVGEEHAECLQREIKMPGAIRWAVEQQQATVLKDAVDDGLSEVMVVQDVTPRGQRRLVGGEQHWTATLVAFVDDVEQDVGGVGSVGEISDFVYDQNVRLQVVDELLL